MSETDLVKCKVAINVLVYGQSAIKVKKGDIILLTEVDVKRLGNSVERIVESKENPSLDASFSEAVAELENIRTANTKLQFELSKMTEAFEEQKALAEARYTENKAQAETIKQLKSKPIRK